MENGNLEPAFLERARKQGHVFQARGTQAHHADHRAFAPGRFNRARGAQHRASSLAQRGFADRIQTVKPASPQDHLDIRRQPVGGNNRGEGNGGDHVLRHPHGQRLAAVEHQIRTHGTAQSDDAVDLAVGIEFCRQGRRTRRHDLHGEVFVPGVDGVLNGLSDRCRHVVLGDVGRLLRVAQHADIHAHQRAALRADDLTDVVQLVVLGIKGSDHQNSLVHRLHSSRHWVPKPVVIPACAPRAGRRNRVGSAVPDGARLQSAR